VLAIRSDRVLEADSGPASRAKSKGEHVTVDWVAVGRRIRETRGLDMTQGEFAGRIGIRQNYLSVMERGKVEIGAEILLRISREFAKSVEWLLMGKG
jgi:DNA-binding XRE family transcriptional regulator